MISFDGTAVAVHPFPAAGRGPDIWLAHATGFCAGCWAPVADGLAAVAGRIVGWDHRGHGGSGSNGFPVSWWEMAGDVIEVVSSFPPRHAPSIGVGHSMGGAATVMAALTRPRLFDAVVLVEPILLAPPYRRTPYPLAEVVRKRRRTFPMREKARANFERKIPFSRWHPDALSGYLSHGLVDTADGVELACAPEFEAEVYDTAAAHGARGLLGRLDLPVHVIVGDVSDTYDVAWAAEIVDAIPGASIQVVAGGTHFIPFERPEVVVEAVERIIPHG
ncbi:MAG: alpha/beta fold hydrolase [Acidimicrobiia bacterium]